MAVLALKRKDKGKETKGAVVIIDPADPNFDEFQQPYQPRDPLARLFAEASPLSFTRAIHLFTDALGGLKALPGFHAKVIKAGEETSKKNIEQNIKFFELRKQLHQNDLDHKKVVDALERSHTEGMEKQAEENEKLKAAHIEELKR